MIVDEPLQTVLAHMALSIVLMLLSSCYSANTFLLSYGYIQLEFFILGFEHLIIHIIPSSESRKNDETCWN